MAKTVVLDELHLVVRIPTSLPAAKVTAVRRTLCGRAFAAALRRAIRRAVRAFPPLTPVRVAVTR